jgi:ribosomal protein S18 acetylase RimI-like enzyme
MESSVSESVAAIHLERHHYAPAMAALGRAFEDDPLLKFVVPDYEKRIKITPELYGGIISYALSYGEAFTTPLIEGAACWLPPDNSSPTFARMLKAGMLKIPVKLGWNAYQRLNTFEAQAEKLHKRHAAKPHWYLWALGVAPEQQGKGIGGILLQPILARADAGQHSCYLETQNEKNLPFYEKHGFKVMETKEIVKGAVTCWAMRREPAR